MKHLSFSLLLLLISLTTFAEDSFISKEELDGTLNKDPYLAYGYQQQQYNLNDIQGDIALLGAARENIKYLGRMLKKDKAGMKEIIDNELDGSIRYKGLYPQWPFNQIDPNPVSTTLTKDRIESFQLSNDSKQLLMEKTLGQDLGFEVKGKSIDPEKFVNAILKIISDARNQGIEPSRGIEHRFAPEVLQYYKKDYPILKTGMSKLFMALGNGLTSRFMVTGQEAALSEFIESKDYDSVELLDTFRESYRLNNGDVYLTILTIENLLSYHWLNPERQNTAVTQRVKSFSYYFNKGDKFGHWYHFWGMILYGYVRGRQAKTVAFIENKLSQLASKENEIQEGTVNSLGAKIGIGLGRAIKNKSYDKADVNELDTEFMLPLDWNAAIQKYLSRPSK